MSKKKNYTAEFKAKVALDAIQSQKGKAEIYSEYKIPATNLYDWKDKAIRDLYQLFIPESEYTKKQKLSEQEIEKLHKIIDEITIENNFLKKNCRNKL